MRLHLVTNGNDQFPEFQPYWLMSYLYLKTNPNSLSWLKSMAADNDRNLIIDSGLYSYMFGSEQGKIPATYEAYLDYVKRYLDDVAGWGLDYHVVEADTQRLLGLESTKRLREEFKPLGSRCMYVWHQPDGIDGLIELAKQVDYMAIGLPELRMIATGQTKGAASSLVKRMCNDLLRRVHEACPKKPPRIHLHPATVARMPPSKDSEYYLNTMTSAYAFSLYQNWLDSRYSAKPARGDALPGGPV